MAKVQANELQSGFVFAKCSKRIHDDCRDIRDALIEESEGCIQEAFTTNAVLDNESWCVAGSFLVPSSRAKGLKGKLLGASTGGKRPVSVKNLRLMFNKQEF